MNIGNLFRKLTVSSYLGTRKSYEWNNNGSNLGEESKWKASDVRAADAKRIARNPARTRSQSFRERLFGAVIPAGRAGVTHRGRAFYRWTASRSKQRETERTWRDSRPTWPTDVRVDVQADHRGTAGIRYSNRIRISDWLSSRWKLRLVDRIDRCLLSSLVLTRHRSSLYPAIGTIR